jgi:hypothetical protein
MRRFPKYRHLLLAGGACGLIAACSDADVASPGSTSPVTVITNPGGGTGGTSFAARASRPRSAADCPSGTEYDAAFTLPDGQTTSVCKIEAENGAVKGTVQVPFAADPVAIVGAVFVGEGAAGAAGALTFAPGQVVFGGGDSDALIVSQGSKLFAEGTATSPIVFTSFPDLNDDLQPNGTTKAGEWGGLVLNGFAPINDCTVDTSATPGTAACQKEGEGSSGRFGGDNPADSSGALRYVRVQHAGILFNSTNELNGIAFQGVGSGTIVEHLQIHKAADDGIEFFGGAVNARYVLITDAEDDSFDWTDGWTGSIQFAIARQASDVGNRGIEADNREGAPDNAPRSNPTISNFTFIGAGTGGENDGVKLRRGTDATLVNGVVSGFALDGLDFDRDSVAATPTIDSTLFAGNTPNVEANADSQAIFDAGANNQTAPASSLNGIVPGPVEQGVTPTDPTSVGAFFTAANYVGAIDPASETAANNWTSGWTVGLGAAASCPSGTILTGEAVPVGRTEARICRVLSPVTGEVTLTPGNLYVIQGTTFIGQDLGPDPANPDASGAEGILNVSPGVTIFGNSGPDALVVSRGSKLHVNGARTAPVVMTSRQDVFGSGAAAGQWGGLVINGRASINDCTVDTSAVPGAVDCNKAGEGATGNFGGASDDDNSGRLNYLRVQYAGFLFNSTNELNGIAFQGVGSGTEVDFVQVHANADDGVEFFGGAASTKHLIITAAEDDSFDWTDGWRGKIQFGIAVQAPTVGNRGIEADNREGAADNTPRSNPSLANFTMFGRNSGAENDGVKLRRGTDGDFYNFIITSFQPEAVDYDADTVLATPAFHTSLIVDTAPDGNGNGQDSAAEANNVFAAANGNSDQTATARTMTADAGFSAALIPGAIENGIAETAAMSAIDLFFDDVDYIGAVRDANDDWYQGWTLPGSL